MLEEYGFAMLYLAWSAEHLTQYYESAQPMANRAAVRHITLPLITHPIFNLIIYMIARCSATRSSRLRRVAGRRPAHPDVYVNSLQQSMGYARDRDHAVIIHDLTLLSSPRHRWCLRVTGSRKQRFKQQRRLRLRRG